MAEAVPLYMALLNRGGAMLSMEIEEVVLMEAVLNRASINMRTPCHADGSIYELKNDIREA